MKYLLRFANEADMLEQLLAVGGAEETGDPEQPVAVIPRAPFGTLVVRGVLGTPGVYIPGEVDPETGETIMDEIEAPVIWPGYHCELYADSVPEALEPYVVVDTDE